MRGPMRASAEVAERHGRQGPPGYAPKSMRLDWSDRSIIAIGFMSKGASKSAVAVQHAKLPNKKKADELNVTGPSGWMRSGTFSLPLRLVRLPSQGGVGLRPPWVPIDRRDIEASGPGTS